MAERLKGRKREVGPTAATDACSTGRRRKPPDGSGDADSTSAAMRPVPTAKRQAPSKAQAMLLRLLAKRPVLLEVLEAVWLRLGGAAAGAGGGGASGGARGARLAVPLPLTGVAGGIRGLVAIRTTLWGPHC